MLDNITFLKGLDNSQLEALQAGGKRRKYKKGSIILSRGDTTNYLFVLMRGQVDAYMEEEDKRIIVNTMTQGESFGELAMLAGEPRSVNIIAVQDCEVLVLQKEDIYKYLTESPDFARNIIQMLARKVNALTEDVRCFALFDVYHRLARVLQQSANSIV